MLSLEDAVARIVASLAPLDDETVPLLSAVGRMLAVDVIAGHELPGFDNSAMDGYAVTAASTEGATSDHAVDLPISGVIAAGSLVGARLESGAAMRILTGAPMPGGADAVVMQEDTELSGNTVRVLRAARSGQHVRRAGEDIARGETVLTTGTILRPGDVAVLAALGHAQVAVRRQPRVWIMPTGDEIVDVADVLAPGQVANSNSYMIAAQVRQAGGVPIFGDIVRDDAAALRKALDAAAAAADLIITCGGVSVGDFDFVREVVGNGVEFWRVAIKPGKPVAFGRYAGVPLVGLPGNPASAFVCFELFGTPAVRRLGGYAQCERPRRRAHSAQPLSGGRTRREFLRGRVVWRGDGLWAEPLAQQGSGQLSSLLGVNALIEAPAQSAAIAVGDEIDIIVLD